MGGGRKGTRLAEATAGPGECGVLGTTLPSIVSGSRIWDICAVAKFEATGRLIFFGHDGGPETSVSHKQ